MSLLYKNKYNIILADAPWDYNDRKLIRKDGKMAKRGIGAGNIYPCMKYEDIRDLSIYDIAADNCALFLWITPPYSDKVGEVITSWGFRFIKSTGYVWLKTYKNGKPFFGVGYYTKSNTELCALGIRGKMKPVSNKVSEVIVSPHYRDPITKKIKHSRKPAVVRSKIVELFGDLPRIELFATETCPGWDSTGFEVDNTDIRDFLRSYVWGVL